MVKNMKECQEVFFQFLENGNYVFLEKIKQMLSHVMFKIIDIEIMRRKLHIDKKLADIKSKTQKEKAIKILQSTTKNELDSVTDYLDQLINTFITHSEFLRLLCEGHNLKAQNLMRTQNSGI
jgi:hypothetical protein